MYNLRFSDRDGFWASKREVPDSLWFPSSSLGTRRKSWRTGWPILIGLLAIACAAVGEAHEVDVFASVDGRSIRGQAKMMGGPPIRSASVRAFDSRGDVLAETVTDDSGGFSFPLEFRCDHRIEVDAGGGHLGRHTVRVAELPTDLPPRGAQSDVAPRTSEHAKTESADSSEDAHDHPHTQSPADSTTHSHPDSSHDDASPEDRLEAIDRQLQALRQDIDRYQARLRIQDMVGAVGYILGLMGLAYYLGVRRKEKAGNDG